MRSVCSFVLVVLVTANGLRGEDPATVDELWKRWKGGDEAALSRLKALGPETKALAKEILHPPKEVFPRNPSLDEWEVLEAMNADGAPAIAAVIGDHFTGGRPELMLLLSQLGPRSQLAADALFPVAVGESGEIRMAALGALAAAGAKPDYMIPELSRLAMQSANLEGTRFPLPEPDRIAAEAALLLGRYPGKAARDGLIRASRFHPTATVRAHAVWSLARQAESDPAVARVIAERLNDHESTGGLFGYSSVSQTALESLLHFETLPENVVEDLLTLLYRVSLERNSVPPQGLVDAICRCPRGGKEAETLVWLKVGPLMEEHRGISGDEASQRHLRVAAATINLRWKRDERESIEYLVKIAGSPVTADLNWLVKLRLPDVRAEAVRGLEQADKVQLAPLLPLLRKIMAWESRPQGSEELAFESAWLISTLDPDDLTCVEVLAKTRGQFRRHRLLTWKQVESVLKDRARLVLTKAEVQSFIDAPEVHSLGTPDLEWEWQLLLPHQAEVVPAYLKLLRSENAADRRRGAIALKSLKAMPEQVVPTLIVALKDPRAVVRAAAAEALGRFGSAARSALPMLKELAGDEYLTVQLAAQEAIAAIGPVEKPLEN